MIKKEKVFGKPATVNSSVLMGIQFATFNVGKSKIEDPADSDGDWECYSVTIRGEINANIVKDSFVENNIIEEVSNDEMEDIGKHFGDKVGVLKTLISAKISSLDKSDKVNSFTINGISLWLDVETRARLKMRLEAEMALGKENATIWYGDYSFSLNVTKAKQMLYAIEVYASTCFDVTQRHIAEVASLKTIKSLLAYDYTEGYPDQLNIVL